MATCATCKWVGHQMLDAFGLEPVKISDVLAERTTPTLDDFDDIEDIRYHGVEISKFARSNAYRYRKRYYLDMQDSEDRSAYQRFLRSGLRVAEVADWIYETYDVDATISFMSAYIYGGIYLKMAQNRDIPARTFRKGYIDKTLLIGDMKNVSPNALYANSEVVQKAIETPLSDTEQRLLEKIMSGRETGETTRQYQIQGSSGELDLGDDSIVVGLFPNVPWDAALDVYNVTFDSLYEWIQTTVDALGDRSDITMILKPHPGEVRAGSGKWARVSDWVTEELEPLPANIVVLSPETEVSPYELMSDLDVGIVYMSTVGMEMAYRGIPMIMVENTHYRDIGFTFDPGTPREYEELLDSLSSLSMDETMQTAVEKYLYLLFVQRHLEFPFYDTEDNFSRQTQRLPVSHETLASDDILEAIVDGVLTGEPVMKPREATSGIEEIAFRLWRGRHHYSNSSLAIDY